MAPLSGALNGAGSSAQGAAMDAWRAAFQSAHSGVTVNYDPVGSGGGRTSFLDGTVAFAGSDALLSADEVTKSKTTCGTEGAIHIPVYISPIDVVFNLDGVTSLKMSPDTIASIFNGKITKWNDAAIAADNAGVKLPDLAITVVHRSDNSGTTSNFTDYLEKAATTWPYPHSGDWPNKIGEAGAKTSGVVAIVQATKGTFGYVDASQAGKFGLVSIKVGTSFVAPSTEGAAIAVGASPIADGANGQFDLAYKLDRKTTAAGAYPLALVSYHILCAHYTDATKGNLVKAFEKYVVSTEGQSAAASAAGSAPIGDKVGALALASVNSIKVG
jgi:phosphate transport system substrate-binding protein